MVGTKSPPISTPELAAVIRGTSMSLDQATLHAEGKQLLAQGNYPHALMLFQQAYDVEQAGGLACEALNNMAFCPYELDQHSEAINR